MMRNLMASVFLSLAAAAFGVGAHIIYLLILVSLPIQESGAARLGERFNDYPW